MKKPLSNFELHIQDDNPDRNLQLMGGFREENRVWHLYQVHLWLEDEHCFHDAMFVLAPTPDMAVSQACCRNKGLDIKHDHSSHAVSQIAFRIQGWSANNF